MEKMESAKTLSISCVRCNKVIPLPLYDAVVYRPPHVDQYANNLDENLRTCGGIMGYWVIGMRTC